jgi:hypothetical protein
VTGVDLSTAILLLVALVLVGVLFALLTHGSGPSEADLKVSFLEEQLADARAREAYWKKRAELYIDRASAKAGLTHEPVMAERSPVEDITSALAGAGMMEFDSTKLKG